MTFEEILTQVHELLERQGRVSYRALKRRFDLDDAYLEDLKAEIVDAKRLAVRAILKEDYSVKDRTFSPEAIQRAKDVLLFHYRHGRTTEELTVEEVASRFKEELADAETWYAELRTKEIGWINSGMNPEVEFDKLYTEAPQLPDEPTDAYPRTWTQRHRDQILVWIAISGAAMIGVAVIFVVRRLCRRPA